MYSFEEIKNVCGSERADQCPSGLQFLLGKFAELNPTSFIQVGPGKLFDFDLFKGLMPQGSLAIGIDYKVYDEWEAIPDRASPYNIWLLPSGSDNPATELRVEEILQHKKVDMLFIDGDHSEYFVRNDWTRYSRFVRPGGLVIFHDYDPVAFHRDGAREGQGAAIVCAELQQQGYTIQVVSPTFIGTAYLYIP